MTEIVDIKLALWSKSLFIVHHSHFCIWPTRPLPQAVLTRSRLSLVAEGDKQYSPG